MKDKYKNVFFIWKSKTKQQGKKKNLIWQIKHFLHLVTFKLILNKKTSSLILHLPIFSFFFFLFGLCPKRRSTPHPRASQVFCLSKEWMKKKKLSPFEPSCTTWCNHRKRFNSHRRSLSALPALSSQTPFFFFLSVFFLKKADSS